jgi:hypothetical protein
LQRLFLRLFEEVAHPQTLPLDKGKVLIDASVTEATFLVTHLPAQNVRLTDPDGRVATQKDPPTSSTWFSTPRYDLEIVARAPTLERRLLLRLDVADAWFDVEIDREVLAPGEVLPLKVRVTNLDIARKDPRIAFVASVRKPNLPPPAY